MNVPRIVVIGGQTASGKSSLALAMARAVDGEIVGADSRQLYQGLTIASAGPDDDDRRRAPHHLYGTVDPATDAVSAGSFVAAADDVVADILGRGKRAIIVGGSGLYLRAFRLGIDDAPLADPVVRDRIQGELATLGLAALVARLRGIDADAAARIDLQNPVRVVRALEIAALGGDLGERDIAALLQRPTRPIARDAAWLLVEPPTPVVDEAIARRARRMFAAGIVDEATALAARLPADHPLLAMMGTKEALDVVAGRSVDDAVNAIVLRTRQFARRQRTWFRKEPWWTRLADATLPPEFNP